MLNHLKQYKKDASRTCLNIGDKMPNGLIYTHEFHELHMIAGIITEFGELMDVYKKKFIYNKLIWDGTSWTNQVINEYGDWGWYVINWVEGIHGMTLEDDGLFLESDDLIIDSLNAFMSTITLDHRSALQTWIDVGYMLGIDHAEAMHRNIAKLKVRFPEKFEADLAINKNEQNELESIQ